MLAPNEQNWPAILIRDRKRNHDKVLTSYQGAGGTVWKAEPQTHSLPSSALRMRTCSRAEPSWRDSDPRGNPQTQPQEVVPSALLDSHERGPSAPSLPVSHATHLYGAEQEAGVIAQFLKSAYAYQMRTALRGPLEAEPHGLRIQQLLIKFKLQRPWPAKDYILYFRGKVFIYDLLGSSEEEESREANKFSCSSLPQLLFFLWKKGQT